jgi:hypothetical protein
VGISKTLIFTFEIAENTTSGARQSISIGKMGTPHGISQ